MSNQRFLAVCGLVVALGRGRLLLPTAILADGEEGTSGWNTGAAAGQAGVEGAASDAGLLAPKQGIFQQAAAALSGLFGDVLSTFNVLQGKPMQVVLATMAVALLFLFFGGRIYRITLVVCGLLLGAALGFSLGEWVCIRFTIDSVTLPLAFAVVLGLLLGSLAVPFVKLTVFIFCGLFGAVFVSYFCERLGLGSSVLWTFASFVILGLLSVSVIRHAMILFTALSGSYLLVAGAVAMLYSLKGILIGSRMDLVWPMIAWIVLFLLGVRAQASKAVEKKHGS